MQGLYIGLMSGTSMDGIDAALVQIDGAQVRLLAHHQQQYPAPLLAELHALCQPGDNEIERLGRADRQIGACFAEASNQLLRTAGVDARQVRAIGSHGQTIRHRPQGAWPFTLQLGCGATIAQRTGIDTVADFRRADLAAGGQGAPLVPAFHQAVLSSPAEPRAVINIGGIANISWLPGDEAGVIGFDTGPGNTLLDDWCRQHLGQPFDRDGCWSASGRANPALLAQLRAEPYFQLAAPKSSGRELFNRGWLQQQGGALLAQLPAADVAATLVMLTATTICDQLRVLAPAATALVCGGGARNLSLMQALAASLPSWRFATTDAYGVDGDYLEAMAFAWLAARHLAGLPGNLPAVTGASRALVLGCLHPATAL